MTPGCAAVLGLSMAVAAAVPVWLAFHWRIRLPKVAKILTPEQLKALRFSNWRKEFMAAQIRRDSANRAVRMAHAADLGAEADALMARVQDDFDREFGP